ncbi:hypothetical protein [Nocardia vermiculata]|uniref:hypothetical protein n=1 Tax=Nocardia vermiculata TaxID=257274 RepID=UPI000A542297|nr:hypothetical protein [Nocardia vermiculata]
MYRPLRSAYRRPALRRTLSALGAGLLLATAACSSSTPSQPTTTTEAPPAETTVRATPFALPGSLAADFAELQPSLGGRASMSIMAVGGRGAADMGEWSPGPAWSTMKAPLALAVLRTNGNTRTYQMTAALTESDNLAADGLWQQLGTPDQAAHAVQAVLREGGDERTTVPATPPRSQYSAFGQADWSLSDQVRWASRLPCLPDSDTVTALMGQVVWGQQWGLGRLGDARFKGGWGPDPQGNYLVRQFGLLPTARGEVAIAIAAQASSGTFDDGVQILNRMTDLLTKHRDDLPAGRCPAGQ